jgi:hypothetical protein
VKTNDKYFEDQKVNNSNSVYHHLTTTRWDNSATTDSQIAHHKLQSKEILELTWNIELQHNVMYHVTISGYSDNNLPGGGIPINSSCRLR